MPAKKLLLSGTNSRIDSSNDVMKSRPKQMIYGCAGWVD